MRIPGGIEIEIRSRLFFCLHRRKLVSGVFELLITGANSIELVRREDLLAPSGYPLQSSLCNFSLKGFPVVASTQTLCDVLSDSISNKIPTSRPTSVAHLVTKCFLSLSSKNLQLPFLLCSSPAAEILRPRPPQSAVSEGDWTWLVWQGERKKSAFVNLSAMTERVVGCITFYSEGPSAFTVRT